MYIPRHWHWVFPVLIVLLGFYIGHNYVFGFDVFIAQSSLTFIACSHAYYIMRAGVMYQAYITRLDERADARKQEQPPREIPNLNEAQTVYGQDTPRVVFDKERQFAGALLAMRALEKEPDLREEFWKRPNKFGSRDAYIAVRDRWAERGILGRKDARKNSPYVVENWIAVELVANGNPLPH